MEDNSKSIGSSDTEVAPVKHDLSSAIKALDETKPPAVDAITYLVLIQDHLSKELLPHLNKILQDAELTQAIGWDLVDRLIPLEGSEECLETIARLGNPREVIIKTLEVIEELGISRRNGELDGHLESKIITLIGMLAILHKRIKAKHPSRFLTHSLAAVAQAYSPNPKETAAVINLVQSLSIWGRPPLPTRKSSTFVANPERYGDSSRNAPDPEADDNEDPTEREIQDRLLLSFVTVIIDVFVQAADLQWSARLYQHYHSNMAVPGKESLLEAFKNSEELQARDAIIGQLVALTKDVGLTEFTPELVRDLCEGPIIANPLELLETASFESIPLSTGGTICIVAYMVFSTAIFGAGHPVPGLHIFPNHHKLLAGYMGEDFQKSATVTPGTVDGLIAIGQWLKHSDKVSCVDNPNYMEYMHFLGLTAVYHPFPLVRNATSSLAGEMLHYNPNDEERLRILEDLIENCTFDALRACAVSWLREEIIAAQNNDNPNVFMSSECIDALEYHLFPNMTPIPDDGAAAFWQNWQTNRLFYLKVANFAYFLFKASDLKHIIPTGLGPAVLKRFVEPLMEACHGLFEALEKKEIVEYDAAGAELDVDIIVDRLKLVRTELEMEESAGTTEATKEEKQA
ncbi:uncharacterized protein MKZ38_002625 [Zalerion maritima]|uniref:DUF1760-domain-containing protein n=1 Tax=Zalerion maritima TaxID=339359 RepID=A0AAD5RXC4_9PEZI|nr:uncharacterized protein MKZ38_002625 [Zalerion maritima]